MLTRLEIENFYSIRHKQVLDFRLPKTTPWDDRFAVLPFGDGVRIPKVLTFFGANASGKTSALRAVTFMRAFVISSFSQYGPSENIEVSPFDCEECHCQDTKLAMEFYPSFMFRTTESPILFRYELEIGYEDGKSFVRREAMLGSHDGRKFDSYFVRRRVGESYDIRASPVLELKKSDPRRVARGNVSLISSLVQFDHKPAVRLSDVVKMSFLSNIYIDKFSKEVDTVTKYLKSDEEALSDLNRRIRSIDLGIERVALEELDGSIEPIFYHRGLARGKHLAQESAGTVSFYLNFVDLHLCLFTGGTAVMDELDADLHPNLMSEIIRWFQSPEENPHGAQLAMTCHNASLISDLQKEEVWLTSKDSDGVTSIVPLSDFGGLRRDSNLYSKYLSGTFGAVPRFG